VSFLVGVFSLVSCEAGQGGVAEAETTGPPLEDAWIEPGWGKELYHPLAEGDDFPIILGGQGSYMFTLALRGGGFPLPDDDVHWSDPSMPSVDAWVDIDGVDEGLDARGHFSSVVDYPISFHVVEGGSYEYVRVSLLLPEGVVEFDDLVGREATLHYDVECGDGQRVVDERRLVVSLSD
jgi:hypothetical protein